MLAIVENQPVCKIYPRSWQIVCLLINSPVPVPDKKSYFSMVANSGQYLFEETLFTKRCYVLTS